jgi:hypothetical protein
MKKQGFLICNILALAVLTGCGSQSINSLDLQPVAPAQNVTAQSNKGFNAFVDFNVKYTFNVLDKNKDSFVTFLEFWPQGPAQPVSPPPPNQTPPSVQSRVSAASQPIPDGKVRFAKLDANRDGKLSINEAKKNARFFLGFDRTQLRTSIKLAFDNANKDKNTVLSQAEYATFLTNAPAEAKFFLNSLFYTSDVNKNGSLTFSEYEDLFYAQMQAYAATITEPAPVVNPEPVPVPDEPDYGDLPDPVDPGYGGQPYPADPGYGNQPQPYPNEPVYNDPGYGNYPSQPDYNDPGYNDQPPYPSYRR